MIVKRTLPIFYILSAIAVIAGTFLPFVNLHYGYESSATTLFAGLFGKVICGIAAVSILAMIIKYTRVMTFLCTAITDACVIVIWAQWKDKLVASAPVPALEAVYTKGYGYYVFIGGAIMLLICGILCFMFVDED